LNQPVLGPNVVAYADLPARYGVQYEIRPDGCVIVLPPPRWWRRIEVVTPLLFILLVIGPLFYDDATKGEFGSMLVLLIVAGGFGVFTRFALLRGRPLVLEVTASEVKVGNAQPVLWTGAPVTHTLNYPRAQVYDVQYVPHSRNIVLRVHGSEMMEFRPTQSPDLNRWIAQQLRRALGFPA
jgi:hypothetical protein